MSDLHSSQKDRNRYSFRLSKKGLTVLVFNKAKKKKGDGGSFCICVKKVDRDPVFTEKFDREPFSIRV